ncbi:MAG: hypothetical protein HOQ17_04495 [Gemmatimonadaceae bacterium]|nr:hypothetical protein [Gemmatimonadaceae bacterium]NUP71568.1 hypothetical protein [Gemmatimonadaceae bacterium]NUR34115.1 hypothetical protein [Gemmatimonadaceae bacterium]NUS32299.1 hypothetical protein [Gemmatimonadaceae bacterium]
MICPPPEEPGGTPAGEPDDGPDEARGDLSGDTDGDPDEAGEDGGDGGDGGDEPPVPRGPFTRENPLTFIVPEPLLLRIERVDRPGAAPGEQPIAFTRAGPREVLLAVNAYPTQLVDAFFASDAFGEPVIVVGAAWEEDGGVRGELSTLLPERTMRAIQESVSPEEDDDEDKVEPWAASASLTGTSYEEAVGSDDEEDDEDDDTGEEDEEDEEAEPHFPLVIGAVLRFPENRRFPQDFELEVDDLMRAILEGRAMDAGEKRIDNLLGGI